MSCKQEPAMFSGEVAHPSKRSKQDWSFKSLPAEILNPVLLSCLLDPKDLSCILDRHSTNRLFAQPILQVSQFLRKRCLDLINMTCLWIEVQVIDRHAMRSSKAETTLPLVASCFRRYISPDAPRVHLSFGAYSEIKRRDLWRFSGTEFTVVFPYNFINLLHICDHFNGPKKDGFNDNLKIEYHNIDGLAEKWVEHLVVPALSTLRGFSNIILEEGGKTYHTEAIRALSTLQKWRPSTLLQKTINLCHYSDAMKKNGYEDEAEILLLGSAWILEEARRWLPHPCPWPLEEDYYYEGPHDFDWATWTEDCRSPIRYKLRRSIHRIEHRACLAFVRLTDKYGRDRVEHHSMSGPFSHRERFLSDPIFTWCGLSPAELSESHCGRALLYEQNDRQTGSYLDDAIVEMFFAFMLRPGNDEIRHHYSRLKGRLPVHRAKEVETICRSRMYVVYDSTRSPQRVLWGGDSKTLKIWGGKAIFRYMRLTEEGLEDTSAWTEWWRDFQLHPESTAGCVPARINTGN